MISKYVREQKRYTQKELCDLFEYSDEKTVGIIRKLKEYGVLKAVRASSFQRDLSELVDEDVEVAEVEVGENDYLYVFTFVGVIVIEGRTIKCFPKYLLNKEDPTDELKQVLKVLDKYNAKEQIVRMFNETSESSSFNLLAVLLYLIQDYYENGVYSNTEDIIESNGSGEISWDKTINETFAFLANNRPYYIDLQTKKRVTNDFDFFQRLHECILTKASNELKEAKLLDLFEITEIDLTDEELDDFGDKDYLLYRIENELNEQYNTRKQLVLKTMYTYIERSGNLNEIDCLSMFGTNSFHHVWEVVCSDIMDNLLDRQLCTLPLPNGLGEGYDGETRLIDLIEKPLWTATGMRADDTLIPDFITFYKNSFVIFDAKYYNAKLEIGIKPKGQPGIESVTKQYLYQQAYQEFIKDHGFASVKNCFILPTENASVVDKGEVSLEMLDRLGLQSIKVRLLPASMAFSHYLSGKKIDIGILEL